MLYKELEFDNTTSALRPIRVLPLQCSERSDRMHLNHFAIFTINLSSRKPVATRSVLDCWLDSLLWSNPVGATLALLRV